MYNQKPKLTKHQKEIKNDILSLEKHLKQAQPKLQMFQTNKVTLQQIISQLKHAYKYTNIQVTNNNFNLIYLQQMTQLILNELQKITQMTDSQFQQWYILSKQDAALQSSMYQSSQNVNYFDQIYQAQQSNSSLDQISEESYSEEEEEEQQQDEFNVLAKLIFLKQLLQNMQQQEQAWKNHLKQHANQSQQQQSKQQQQQQQYQQQAKPQQINFQIPQQNLAECSMYRSQKNPNQVIKDNSQCKIETPLPQCFKTRYSIPIIVKHPQLTQDVEFSISKDVDLETVWDKVQLKVKFSKFNLLWFLEPKLNDKKHLRYEPLSKLEIEKDRLEFSIVTTQQANFVVDQKTDNEVKYYYELKLNNETYKMHGDGISFLEKQRGYLIISQIYKDDEIMDKQTLRFAKVQSIRICHPAKPVYTSLKGEKKDEIFRQKYILNLQELQFLDNQNFVQVTFNYHEGQIFKYKHQYMIKKEMPSYLMPSYYKYKQHSYNPEQSIYFDGFDYNPNSLIKCQQSIDINNTARKQENENIIEVEMRICGGEIFSMNVQAQLFVNHVSLDLSMIKSKLAAQYGQGSIYRGSMKVNDLQSCIIPTIKQAVFYYYEQNEENNAIILNFVINSKTYQYPFCLTHTINEIIYLSCQILENFEISNDYVINYKGYNLLTLDENTELQDLNMKDQDYISIFNLSGHKSPSFYSKYMSFNEQYSINEIIDDFDFNQQQIMNYANQKAQKIQKIKIKTSLLEGEIFSIMIYTSDLIYSDLNANLNATKVFKGDEHTASYSKYMSSMLSGLSKIGECVGKVYRGIKQRVDAEKVRVGKFVCFQSFMSSSEEKEVAFNFAQSDDGQQYGTFFEIDILSGVPISQLSEYKLEKEILLTPYIWYKVINSYFIQQYNIQYVALQEVPTPKSFKIALICSQVNDVNSKLRQICCSKGYTCIQVCKWEDLDLSFQRFQHFFNNLAPENLLIIINATQELNKNYLEVLFTKFKYRREVFYYSQNIYDNNQYIGLLRRFYDNNINQNYVQYTNEELVNLILNYYLIPLRYLDLTYNREWIAGKSKKGLLEYHYPHQFQGIGVKVKNNNCFSNDYCVAYVGIEFDQLINYLNQYPNKKYTMTKIGETICNTPNLYFTNNAQEAAYMVSPKVLENKQFYLVLQVRLFIKAIQVFNQVTQYHQIYTCSDANYIQIQRILIQIV